MEMLDFTFKKSRRLGELLQDYISLFKKIFKHFNGTILTMALPFIAFFILAFFYLTGFITDVVQKEAAGFSEIFPLFIILSLVFFILFFIASAFGIEYMFLLEERGNTGFGVKDIFAGIKRNLVKYVSFFFASIVVGLILAIPLAIVAMLLAFIPILGALAIGIVSACVSLFFYCALFLYLQGREGLWESYQASYYLIKSKLFEYGVASYIFQFLAQIILGILTLIPIVILAIIGFTTLGFNEQFFDSFLGKFLVSLGGGILFLFVIIALIYLVAFYALQYFSLLESSYKETTLETIDQIGEKGNES